MMNNRIIPLVGLVIAFTIFFTYVRPQWDGPIAEAKAAIAGDNDALAAADQYKARENQLASERNAMNPDDLARLEALLPDSVDNVGMILDLNNLASRSGLSLTSIGVSTGPQGGSTGASTSAGSASGSSGQGPVGSVELTLSATGTYNALKEFLKGVEHSQRLLDVRSLSVNSSDTGVYNFEIRLRLYWLR